MKLKVLGCYGGRLPGKKLTSFLIDDTILVDAGSATAMLSKEELTKIKTIIVSHSHLDHVYDIPLLGDVIIAPDMEPREIVCIEPTANAISELLMGNVIWPDFTSLPTKENPVFNMRIEQPRKPFVVGDYEVEFIHVTHPVPCVAMLFRWEGGAFLYTADTGPTEEVWQVAAEEQNLRGVITEISFPNMLKELSLASGHLSPCHMDEELGKMGRDDIPVYIYHLKPAFEELLLEEIKEISYPNLSLLKEGQVLEV